MYFWTYFDPKNRNFRPQKIVTFPRSVIFVSRILGPKKRKNPGNGGPGSSIRSRTSADQVVETPVAGSPGDPWTQYINRCIYIYILSSSDKLPGSFFPSASHLRLGSKQIQFVFFSLLPVYQNYICYNGTKLPVFLPVFWKQQPAICLPVYSKQQLVPKRANPDRIIQNLWTTCKKTVKICT